MSLQKYYEFKGIKPFYWKIIGFSGSIETGALNCTLALFVNKETKEKLDYLKTIDFSFPISEYDFKGDIREYLYKKIKETDLFKDAKDI